MEALPLFLTFLRAAALSVGGLSSLPLLRQDLVAPGVVTERQVIEALALGRLSTGPSGLYVVSLGYFAFGWPGAVIALVAAAIPPLAIVPAAAHIRRQLLSPWAAGLVRGVALSTSGLVVATGIQLIAPDRQLLGVPPWQLALAVIGGALTIHGKLHPALLVIGGASIGLVLGR